MKTFFRYFLFLALCSCCYTANVGAANNVSYIVGDNYGVGHGNQKWRDTGLMEMSPSNSGMVQAPTI